MDVFGITLPLWAIFIGVIIGLVVLWKLIKFALTILVVIVVFFAILIGLDVLGVFTWLSENVFSSLI